MTSPPRETGPAGNGTGSKLLTDYDDLTALKRRRAASLRLAPMSDGRRDPWLDARAKDGAA